MRNEIQMTDEQIEDMFDEQFGAMPSMSKVTLTRETIEDFVAARSNYAEAGSITKNEGGALMIERAQVASGQPRKHIHVLDLGAVRACYIQIA